MNTNAKVLVKDIEQLILTTDKNVDCNLLPTKTFCKHVTFSNCSSFVSLVLLS
jgi:hypothetical protein